MYNINAGGEYGYGFTTYHDDILEFSYFLFFRVWTKIGEMSLHRENHAVSVINYNSIKDYCK